MDMIGLKEIQPEKGSMGVRFLNVSQAHLREAKQEQRAQSPQKVARVGGIPTRVKERLDHFEASLSEMWKALQ